MPLMPWVKQGGRCLGITAATCAPFAAHVMPKIQQTVPLFPPVGGVNLLLNSFAGLMIAACALLAYHHRKQQSASTKYRRGFAVAAVGFLAYVLLTLLFVVSVPFPDHTYQLRSVGFLRTKTGRESPELKDVPNALAVQVAGSDEAFIETVWEPWSIYTVRFFLVVSYIVALGSLNYGFAAVKVDLNDAG